MAEQKPRSRIRDRLSEYYDIGNQQKQQSASPQTSDMNAPNFDVDKYVSTMIRGATLQELIQKDNDLSTEVKGLDGDMQNLVYENYNKFISATDTIRKMKTNVENMHEELDQLQETMDAISTKSESINDNLSVRRARVEQLNGVRRLLKKLQFLFELPTRLNRAVELEAYSEAVKYFNMSSRVLNMYSHQPAFQAIKAESDLILDKLRQRLRKKLKQDGAAVVEVTESVALLLKLNEPADGLRLEYMHCRQTRLQHTLQLFSQEIDLNFPTAAAPKTTFSLQSDQFLSDFEDYLKSFSALFLTSLSKGSVDEGAVATAHAALLSSSTSLFQQYLKQLDGKLQNIAEGVDLLELVRGLDQWHASILRFSKFLPEAEFAGSAAAIVEATGRRQLALAFATLQANVVGHLLGMEPLISAVDLKTKDSTYLDIVTNVLESIVDDVQHLLLAVRALTVAESSFMRTYSLLFTDSLHTSLFDLLAHLSSLLSAEVDRQQKANKDGQQARTQANPTFVLLFAYLCVQLESSGLPKILEMLKENVTPANSESIFNADQLVASIKLSAQALLSDYVELRGLNITQMIHKSMQTPNWLKLKEPRDVRLVVDLIVQEISGISKELGQVFLETSPSAEDEAPGGGGGAGARGVPRNNMCSAIEKNIERLFTKKLQLNGDVEFRSRSVLSAIIRSCLKTFYEYVRLYTFGKFGFQQIQVDTYFLRIMLRPYVDDDVILDTLLDEVLTSATDRCLDPRPMDQNIIDQICDAKRSKLQQ